MVTSTIVMAALEETSNSVPVQLIVPGDTFTSIV